MTLSLEYTFYAKAFVGLLAIVNPLGAIPVFLSLCGDRTPMERRNIARTTAISVGLVLIVSLWVGDMVLKFFGITIAAFLTGGGILIVMMAMSMLHARQSHAKQSPVEAEEASDKEDIAVVPLAIPLLAGPGAISLTIADAHHAEHLGDRLILSVAVLGVALLVWISFNLASPIGERLGITGLNVATRIMGLLLAAIGVQMFSSGILKLLPGLA